MFKSGRRRFLVMLPVLFPATRADLLRLVITAKDAPARYEKFLSDEVKTHWAGGFLQNYAAAVPVRMSYFASLVTDEHRAAHVGKTDVEISQALFDAAFQTALAAERKRFERGFENREGWKVVVRKYGVWEKSKKS
jgi:hypothetical protein